MQIKIKKLIPNAVIPTYAHPTDAGMDITATSHTIDEYGCHVYGTGLAFEIPEGYVGLLFPRSSNAKKTLLLSNCVGVIDSGYRGEVTFKFKPSLASAIYGMAYTPIEPELYRVGDRIGQIIILPYPKVKFVEVEELSSSDRGTGGYGSTGY